MSYTVYVMVFSRVRSVLRRLHVFPRLAPVTCFPALGTGYVFPRLAPVTCFPALGTGYMFFRTWHQLHVFPRLAPVTCFFALCTLTCFSALIDPLYHLKGVTIQHSVDVVRLLIFSYMKYKSHLTFFFFSS